MQYQGLRSAVAALQQRERFAADIEARVPLAEYHYDLVGSRRDSVILLKSSDGAIFQVREAIGKISGVVAHYAKEKEKMGAEDIIFELHNVAEDVLEKILEFCYFYNSTKCAGMTRREREEWNILFIDRHPQELCELASAAYYMDVKPLVDLTCKQIASMISGKSAEEIRTTFNIEHDWDEHEYREVFPQEWYYPGGASTERQRARLLSMQRHSRRLAKRLGDTHHSVKPDKNLNADDRPVEELLKFINGEGPSSRKKKKKKGKRGKAMEPEENSKSDGPSDVDHVDLGPGRIRTLGDRKIGPPIKLTFGGSRTANGTHELDSFKLRNGNSQTFTSRQDDKSAETQAINSELTNGVAKLDVSSIINQCAQERAAAPEASTNTKSKSSKKRARKRARKRTQEAVKNPIPDHELLYNALPAAAAHLANGAHNSHDWKQAPFKNADLNESCYSDEEALDSIDNEVAAFADRLRQHDESLKENRNGVDKDEDENNEMVTDGKEKNIRALEQHIDDMHKKVQDLDARIAGLNRERCATYQVWEAAMMELGNMLKEGGEGK